MAPNSRSLRPGPSHAPPPAVVAAGDLGRLLDLLGRPGHLFHRPAHRLQLLLDPAMLCGRARDPVGRRLGQQ